MGFNIEYNSERVVGKHSLESLTTGMYKNPFTIYREYIQNSSDAIDAAVVAGILTPQSATINITIDKSKKIIVIKDNGTGIKASEAFKTLGDIGNSKKKHQDNRGFRGIGRLAGFTYAKSVVFITSYCGEPQRTIISFDCQQMREILHSDDDTTETAIEVLDKITHVEFQQEKLQEHYFEVRLEGVFEQFNDLLDESTVLNYLAEVAPIPFDDQLFLYAGYIRDKYKDLGKPLEEYKLFLNGSKKPIKKMYKTNFKTGHQQKEKQNDRIKEILFFEKFSDSGELLYFGWYAKTSFFGTIRDSFMKGIRLRKGNILIGDEFTFGNFFPESRLNGWLIGEVYVFANHLIPNSQRDDFEENQAYRELQSHLLIQGKFFYDLVRYTSEINSRTKVIEESEASLNQIKKQIETGGITSEHMRDQLLRDKADLEIKLHKAEKELVKLVEKTTDDNSRNKVERSLEKANKLRKTIVKTENDIVNKEYSTKNDLPSSFSRDEVKMYQRIINVVDENVDMETAKILRRKIIEELSKGKKAKK